MGVFLPVVYQRVHPGWLVYAHCELGEEVRVGVRYETSDLQAVRAFIAANHALGSQFPNDMVPATIVFRAAFPVDELTRLVLAGGFEVGSFEASGVRPDGTKFPLGGPMLPGSDPVPQRMVDMQLTLRGEPPASVVEGVLLIRGKLDRATFDRLVADPRVLLVDVSSHFAQREVARHFGADPAKLKNARGGPESFLHVAARHGLIPSDAPVGLPGGVIGGVGGASPMGTALANQPGPGVLCVPLLPCPVVRQPGH